MHKTCRRETRRWNFERYVTVHQEQHTILDGLVQHGHAGIDECSKTRYMMNGIKTNVLDSVKTQILADTGLRNDFSRCIVLYTRITLHKTTPTGTQISTFRRSELNARGEGQ